MTAHKHTTQRGITLIEILFATMILSVGLAGILAFFPLGVDMHNQSMRDEKSAMVAESLKDAIVTSCKYAVVDNGQTQITVVHDGMGLILAGVPEGKEIITLPVTAQPITRDDQLNPTPPWDVKYENNDFVRFPDQAGQRVYHLGQILLQSSPDNVYYNSADDYSSYSFDIQVREAVTSRRPKTPAGDEQTNSLVRVYELASDNHDEYEFTIRIYQQWRQRSTNEIAIGAENATLVRVYTFVAAISR